VFKPTGTVPLSPHSDEEGKPAGGARDSKADRSLVRIFAGTYHVRALHDHTRLICTSWRLTVRVRVLRCRRSRQPATISQRGWLLFLTALPLLGAKCSSPLFCVPAHLPVFNCCWMNCVEKSRPQRISIHPTPRIKVDFDPEKIFRMKNLCTSLANRLAASLRVDRLHSRDLAQA
jgi:hypothetical protein